MLNTIYNRGYRCFVVMSKLSFEGGYSSFTCYHTIYCLLLRTDDVILSGYSKPYTQKK